ncbi:MAG: hypothetical protein NT062_16115 [Proteobacteria bacterium]|nr:hypothetical protein [Pseudomonadota bacterium]
MVLGHMPDGTELPAFREVHVLVLRGVLERARIEHEAGRVAPQIGPIPAMDRSDADPVAIAFVGWASGSADDDQIAAALYPEDYASASEGLADLESLRACVRERRACYESWRAGRPFKAWMLSGGMRTEK